MPRALEAHGICLPVREMLGLYVDLVNTDEMRGAPTEVAHIVATRARAPRAGDVSDVAIPVAAPDSEALAQWTAWSSRCSPTQPVFEGSCCVEPGSTISGYATKRPLAAIIAVQARLRERRESLAISRSQQGSGGRSSSASGPRTRARRWGSPTTSLACRRR